MAASILRQAHTDTFTTSRRYFLRQVMAGAAASAALPSALTAGEVSSLESGPRGLRGLLRLESGAAPDEAFWLMVKEQFPLRQDLILMNAANLCPTPFPVLEALFGLARDIDSDASHQNRGKFRDMQERSLSLLADYLGADAEELVITRNTTEGNNVVVSGLELGAGDEVVIWDQNHPTNALAWDVRGQRRGFSVRRVSTPPLPRSEDELVAPFLEAISPATRALAFSHISNVSGVALPARRLCQEARRLGILTLVDGAQCFGFLELDMHDLGCDFYTASTHKWFMGPKEAGILFVRRDVAGNVWPLITGLGWEGVRDRGARRFGALGQRDDARLAAVARAVEFHRSLGPRQVENRVRELAAALKERIAERIPGVAFHTPADPTLSGGVVVVRLPGVEARAGFDRLYHEHGIGGAAMGGDFEGIRFSPNVYNLVTEVERVVEALVSL